MDLMNGVDGITIELSRSIKHVHPDFSTIGILLLLLGIGVFFIWFYFVRPRSMLKQWADAYRFEFVKCQRRWLFKGPYAWLYQHCAIYRITVKNHQGYERSGWLCCGDLVLGLFQNKTDVTWDDKKYH